MARTHGTNPQDLGRISDAKLKELVIASALDVAKEANRPGAFRFELLFSIGTMNSLEREVRRRTVNDRADAALSMDDRPAPVELAIDDRPAPFVRDFVASDEGDMVAP